MKKRAFELMQCANENDPQSKRLDLFIVTLIAINLIVAVVETFDIPQTVQKIITNIENISVIIFTVEYILRVWTADCLYEDLTPLQSRIKYIFSFMAFIDLLAILPFYIPLLIPIDLRVLRALRIIRMFRFFKIGRYTDAFITMGKVFRSKSSQLFSSVFVVGLLMVISAVLMYNVENSAQPDKFDNAFSGVWWSISTLTTVGYGDIYPVTVIGKLLSIVIAMLGIGLIAVPTGIITSGFIEVLNEEKRQIADVVDEKCYCPYCGHRLDE
ncbi:MAG: ion transporter [Clostridia bacterium]|nr:ion transporter [Clostridia bacterium]